MQYCCDPKKCPCGPDRCANKPLNKREGVPEGKDGLRVIWVRPRLPLVLSSLVWMREARELSAKCRSQTGNRGFGLKTMVDIKEGDFVIEYRGEVRRPPLDLFCTSSRDGDESER